jgi:signal transduction histidine kinase
MSSQLANTPAVAAPPPAARRGLRFLPALAYAAFWLGVGLFQALAEWERYVRRGDPYPWEPFLWELSSTAVIGVLALAVHRWNLRLIAPARGWPSRVAGHLAGLAAFTLAHSALMYALRFAVYGLAGVAYAPGGALVVLGYEAPKDAVTYAILVGLSLGLHVFLREQRQAAELARVSEQLAQARLAQLQAQLHPHFLFNALNLVSSVMHEDVERADRILAELADLLRLSLGAGRRTMHGVAEELRWVESFLSIMRQRFGERLVATIRVEPEAAACAMPALLLVAPVENAVKHGVARASGATEVRVLARRAGGRLEIAVVDTGDGGPAPEGDGIGLANARARLAALYGDAAQVSLERRAGETWLRMSFPAEAAP